MTATRGELMGSGPRYMQLATTLINEIRSGHYPVGSLLPTEYELCGQFGVSRFTVREAVKKLVHQGLIVRQPGVGSRVLAQSSATQYTQTMSGMSDLNHYADETSLLVRDCRISEVRGETAEQLGASPGETWLHIDGLRYVKGQAQPIAHTEVFIAPRFRSVSGIAGRMRRALYEVIEEQFECRINSVHQEIRAMILPAATAKLLGVPARSAGLLVLRRYVDERDDLVELAINVHPADRFIYRESFRRDWQAKA